MEIILLVIGVGAFIASFVIPEKLSNLKEEDKQFGKEQINELLEAEMNGVKNRVELIVDETINYAVEKTERSFERISNEKILAVNEYSEVVLKDINRNHDEVMFLYDMLNDKQKNIKSTVREVEQTAKAMKQSVKALAEPDFKPIIIEQVEASNKVESVNIIAETTEKKVSTNDSKTKAVASSKKSKNAQLPDVDIQFTTGNGKNKNNNERILELHKFGKSNMSIAKELNLGVGEVKLVIDLFEGM